jgi:hypothetical protein
MKVREHVVDAGTGETWQREVEREGVISEQEGLRRDQQQAAAEAREARRAAIRTELVDLLVDAVLGDEAAKARVAALQAELQTLRK